MSDQDDRNQTVPNAASKAQAAMSSILPRGTRLQEFEVAGLVGEGGFGVVYRAKDTLLDRTVAIKEYLPSQLVSRLESGRVKVRQTEQEETFVAGLRSFINEAKMLAQFKHPALVEVFRFWEENGTAYMAMPLYEGATLKDHLSAQAGLVSQRWLQAILAPLLDALEHMHAAQIYHRDIAPDNILILKTGSPVLLDLGAARRVVGNMTQALTVILKPGYAPVEQYADDPAVRQGPWTDVYALAATIYFAIARRAPPPAVSRMIRDPYRPLTEIAGEGFDRDFLSAVDQALAVTPEQRPQSIAEFRTLLGVRSFSIAVPPTMRVPAPEPSSVPAPQAGTQAANYEDPDKTVPAVPIDLGALGSAASRQAPPMPAPAPKPASPQGVATPTGAAPGMAAAATDPAPPGAAASSSAAPPVAPTRPVSEGRAARDTRNRMPLIIGASLLGVALLAIATWLLWRPDATAPQATKALTAESAPPALPARAEPSQPRAEPPQTPSETASAPTSTTTPITATPSSVAPSSVAPSSSTTSPPGTPQTAAAASAPTPSAPAADAKSTAPTTTSAPLPKTGTLRLAITPWGEVLVDGASKGVSPPLKRLTLPEGSYQIEIKNPVGPSMTRRIEVRSGQSLDINHQF